MKLTLEFDPETERDEMRQAVHADVAWACLYDVVYYKIRNHTKHGEPLTVEGIRDYIHEYMHEHGVTLDGMIK